MACRLFVLIFCYGSAACVLAQTWQMQSRALPVVAENAPCNPAVDTIGITPQPAILVSCQGGTWKRNGRDSVITPLYLRNAGAAPAPCPAGWTQADLAVASESASAENKVRTCLPPAGKACSVMYFKNAGTPPAACPSPWQQADLGFVYEGNNTGNYVRACHLCR